MNSKLMRLATWRSAATQRVGCMAMVLTAIPCVTERPCGAPARFQHVSTEEPAWVFLCAEHERLASENGSVVVVLREAPNEARR